MFRHVTAVVLTATLGFLAGAANGCGPQPGGNNGVQVSHPQCQWDVVRSPHVVGETGHLGVSASVSFRCDDPPPLSHHAKIWVAMGAAGGWFPIGSIVRDDRIPGAGGYELTAVGPCEATANNGQRRYWRVYVEVTGRGPASRAAPDGIAYKTKTTQRSDMHETLLACRGTP